MNTLTLRLSYPMPFRLSFVVMLCYGPFDEFAVCYSLS
jgi:hypothetical protein